MGSANLNKPRVGMVGYFGWGNFGDELFIRSHEQHLGSDYDLYVVNDLLEEPYFSKPVDDIVADTDAFIIGGGDLINPLRISSLYWREEFLQKPTFVFGLGVPGQPFRRDHVVDFYSRFLNHENCKVVVARDVESYDWIKENLAVGDKLTWYPDPVCSVRRPDAVDTKGEKILGVTIREHRSLSEDLSAVRALIDEAKNLGYRIKHIALGTDSIGEADLNRARSIAESDEEVVGGTTLDDLCREISSCSALATIKFHGMVIATMYGIPSIAMSVTPKNKNFLRMIEREEMACSYTDALLPEKLSKYPARIHSRVRGNLYYRSKAGYDHLRSVMAEAL